jgi:CHAT domain-containing protein
MPRPRFSRGARAVALSLLFSLGLPLAAVDPARADDAADFRQVVVQLWQQVKGLIEAGKYAEAAAVLEQLQGKLDQVLGPTHEMSVNNRKLLELARQGAALSGQSPAPPSAPPPPPPSPPASGGRAALGTNSAGKTEIPAADIPVVQAANAKAQQGRDLLKAGKYAEGAALIDEALPVMERILGPDHDIPRVNRELLLTILREKLNQPYRAVEVESRTAEIRRNWRPPQPQVAGGGAAGGDVQGAMEKLTRAMTAFQSHDFQTALTLFEEALPVMEKTLGPDNPLMSQVWTIQASLYDYALQYDKAEALRRRALELAEKKQGPESFEVADICMFTVTHYMRRGEPHKAVPYAERAVRVFTKVRPNSKELVDALEALAQVSSTSGDQKKAKAALQQAGQVVKTLSPFDVPRMVRIASTLATVIELDGDPKLANETRQAACELAEASADAKAMDSALSDCVAAAWSRGDLVRAEGLLERKLQGHEAQFGKRRSVFWAAPAHNLALVRYALGKHDAALTLAAEVAEYDESVLRVQIATGSDAQKRQTFEEYQSKLYDVLSMGGGGQNPASTALAFETVLRRKGRALDASADAARAARLLTSPEHKALLAKQQSIRGMMAGLVLRGGGDLGPDGITAALEKLEAEDQEISKTLAQQSPEYRTLTQPIATAAVQQALPADTALVEYALYIQRDAHLLRPASMRYVAYVLRNNRGPVAIDLGDARPIMDAVKALREPLASRKDVRAPARRLAELVMDPVRKQLGAGVSRLVISPDDDLNLVPFAALLDASNKYLIESFEIDYLTSGRDLLRLAAFRPAQAGPLIVGNPAFDATGATGGGGGQRSGDLGRARFTPLPGTATEIEAIGKELGDARVLSGNDATKLAVSSAQAPLVLHVATHGFFLEGQPQQAGGTRALALDFDQAPPPPRGENPLIRSGLAFAGANDKSNAAGVLTALEASGINLDGTRLVVLSACETGVGKVEIGDGVYGLRRALLVAGSESQIMSLWKVDDAATRDLMIGLYKGLRGGKGRGQALRETQLALLASKERAHPYYWAAFIPSGNWGKMDFTVASPTGAPAGTSSSSSSSDDDDDWYGEVLTSDGGRVTLYGRGLSTTNLLNQPDRSAGMFGMGIEFALLSGERMDGTGLAFHDAAVFELELGIRTSDPWYYSSEGMDEGGLAGGYFAAYQAAVGLRGRRIGLLAGVRPGYRAFAIGGLRSSGWVFPWYGVLELRPGDETLLSLSGWYGQLLVDHPSLGGRLDVSFGDAMFLRFAAEQYKLDSTVGVTAGEDRVNVGRQVSTAYTFALGGHF